MNDYKPIEANYLISRLATISGKVLPVLCGSALKIGNSTRFGLINYLPSPDEVLPVEDVSNRDTQSPSIKIS